jgi:hypothetical protein
MVEKWKKAVRAVRPLESPKRRSLDSRNKPGEFWRSAYGASSQDGSIEIVDKTQVPPIAPLATADALLLLEYKLRASENRRGE